MKLKDVLISLKKRLYIFTTLHFKIQKEWTKQYWIEEENGIRYIPCKLCPKYDFKNKSCMVPFGTALRKCVTAASESNLRDFNNMKILEIGCGELSYAKKIVENAGSTWVGIDPRTGKGKKKSVRTLYGHVANIPFEDSFFDVVFGIQTLEHFEEKSPNIDKESNYDFSLQEIWRVLKPGGWIYFDAPIHLHGHEMFITGDIDRIKKLFKPHLWTNLILEKWRYAYKPLPKYSPPLRDTATWHEKVFSCDKNDMKVIEDNASVWLLTIKAQKIEKGNVAI